MAIHYSDINTAFLHVLKDVAQYGKATTTRDMNVYEVLDYSFIIDEKKFFINGLHFDTMLAFIKTWIQTSDEKSHNIRIDELVEVT